jgi:hypothetical protein
MPWRLWDFSLHTRDRKPFYARTGLIRLHGVSFFFYLCCQSRMASSARSHFDIPFSVSYLLWIIRPALRLTWLKLRLARQICFWDNDFSQGAASDTFVSDRPYGLDLFFDRSNNTRNELLIVWSRSLGRLYIHYVCEFPKVRSLHRDQTFVDSWEICSQRAKVGILRSRVGIWPNSKNTSGYCRKDHHSKPPMYHVLKRICRMPSHPEYTIQKLLYITRSWMVVLMKSELAIHYEILSSPRCHPEKDYRSCTFALALPCINLSSKISSCTALRQERLMLTTHYIYTQTIFLTRLTSSAHLGNFRSYESSIALLETK